MKQTDFEEVSEDTLENVTGGRRKENGWKRNAISFLKGFLNSFVTTDNHRNN